MINQNDLIFGKMPENGYEVVVDKMSIEKMFKQNNAKMAGILSVEEMIGREISITNMDNFKIVGICDMQSPSIYTSKDMFINILSNTSNSDSQDDSYFGMMYMYEPNNTSENTVIDNGKTFVLDLSGHTVT